MTAWSFQSGLLKGLSSQESEAAKFDACHICKVDLGDFDNSISLASICVVCIYLQPSKWAELYGTSLPEASTIATSTDVVRSSCIAALGLYFLVE